MWFKLEVMIWNWELILELKDIINIYLQDKPLWNIRLNTQDLEA